MTYESRLMPVLIEKRVVSQPGSRECSSIALRFIEATLALYQK